MIEVEFGLFSLGEEDAVAPGADAGLVVAIADGFVHGEDAELMQEPSDEGVFAEDGGNSRGDGPGGGRGEDAALPEVVVAEVLGVDGLAAQAVAKGEAQGEGTDAVEAHDDDGLGNGGDGPGLRVEAGVDGPEDFAGEGRVVGDGGGEVVDIDVGVLDEVDHFQGDGRDGRQSRGGDDVLEQVLVHAQIPSPSLGG